MSETTPPPQPPPKLPVLGTGISSTSYDEVAECCRCWVECRRERPASVDSSTEGAVPGRYICVTSVHGVITAFRKRAVRASLNGADIATPDGMPIVWALRSIGAKKQERVYGPTLMLKLCEQAERVGHRVFFYGGREETLDALCEKLKDRFPDLVVAGAYSPPFRPLTPSEDAQCTQMIVDSDADLVFVGISTPKQDHWMAEHRDRLGGAVMIGVGAAFDFHAGRVKQAPSWMQRAGLEWFFRLLMEPRRLWRRYILETPLFLPLWAFQKVGLLKYPPETAGTLHR